MLPVVYILVATHSGARVFKYYSRDELPIRMVRWNFRQRRVPERSSTVDRDFALALNRLFTRHPHAKIVVAADGKRLMTLKKDLNDGLLLNAFVGVAKDLEDAGDDEVWAELAPYVHESMAALTLPDESLASANAHGIRQRF